MSNHKAMSDEWIEEPAVPLILPDLAGKTAIVTGASLGIGRATADLLLQNGVRVFGLSHDHHQSDHGGLTAVTCDLAREEDIETAFEEIRGHADRIDFVVNVAGIDPKYPIAETSYMEWDRLININLRAYYFVIQKALPLLYRGSGKSIVNVSSINYRLGVPGRAAYSASKAGILGLTTGISRELGARGIRVNTVTPGWIFTERQIEEYFKGEPGEKNLAYLAARQSVKVKISATDIANHILFYLSAVSRASTGHNSVVDGGWLLE